jgi:DNA invertase Pin-like site-specific DNA recombinase
MSIEAREKVQAEHRKRNAYVYVRQSTLRQVLENTESTQRQYGLQNRAEALGWAREQIVVIDGDLGQSGASAVDRAGFQKLVAEVGLGRVGIVIGLEVSRLARNSADWHRLLELCALNDTLILDEDGIYDPSHYNDRLVLGLKGTMSEAELHVLSMRLRGGILHKVRRGEFALSLPAGFVYDEQQRVIPDPDQQVQHSVRQLFEAFRRRGSVLGTVREFREKGWRFPVRSQKGRRPGDLQWGALTRNRAYSVLRNPRYAGAYAYGQNRNRKKPDGAGRRTVRLPREQWYELKWNAHAGYLSREEYEENLRRLRENAPPPNPDRRGAPREGPALLQGLAFCGRCGARMGTRYHHRGNRLVPDYVCNQSSSNRAEPVCQFIPGMGLDQAIGKLLVETVTPVTLELALEVNQQIQAQEAAADRLRRMQVERARYEAGLAERRYKRVDPDNRLVAATLEADWNGKLSLAHQAEQEYERLRLAGQQVFEQGRREQILNLARDFPQIWQDPKTPDRERKRMVRLLLEDVTLHRDQQQIAAHIRFKGGATQTVYTPIQGRPDPKAVAEIERLLEDKCSYAEVAASLNDRGFRTARSKAYNVQAVRSIEHRYLPNRRADSTAPPPPALSVSHLANPCIVGGAV